MSSHSDPRSKWAALVEDREKLARCMRNKQEELNKESERQREDSWREQEKKKSGDRPNSVNDNRNMSENACKRNSKRSWI